MLSSSNLISRMTQELMQNAFGFAMGCGETHIPHCPKAFTMR